MAESPRLQEELDALVRLAKRFSERRMFGEAADLFLLALQLDPRNSGIKLALAEVRRMQRQYKETRPRSIREMVREQGRRDAIDADQFLGLARFFADKGQNPRAIECLEVAAAKGPPNCEVHKLHGRILARRNKFDDAARELGQALRYNPFDREVAEALGRVEYERRQFLDALLATIHAYLLLNVGDLEGSERLRRRIRTLRQILDLENQDLVRFFHRTREKLNVSFDRLQWHRERFLAEGGLIDDGEETPHGPQHRPGELIDMAMRLRRLGLWQHLSDEQVLQVSRAIQEEFFEQGATLFAHGSSGEDFYLLERGEISIQRQNSYGRFKLGTLNPGALFGEANFISRLERSGDAVASQPAVVLRVDSTELRRIIGDSAELGVQLYWSFWHALAKKLRATNEQLRTFFSDDSAAEGVERLRQQQEQVESQVKVDESDKIRLFREQGLSHGELMTLATFSREKRFSAGTTLFREGDEGREMYVVLEGRVRISKHIPGAGEEALAILERGDFFGEMSLIDDQPRSADARAHDAELTVLALGKETIREVLSMDAHAALELLELLCRLITRRLREIDAKIVSWRILAGAPSDDSQTVVTTPRKSTTG